MIFAVLLFVGNAVLTSGVRTQMKQRHDLSFRFGVKSRLRDGAGDELENPSGGTLPRPHSKEKGHEGMGPRGLNLDLSLSV